MLSASTELLSSLHEVFGFSEFRALQEDAVRAAVDGRDVLVVMPTGAGKSLCYQLPAALMPGFTLVVSPLVALMRDQVAALGERTAFGQLGAACLNSLQSSGEQMAVLDELCAGRLRLLYVAPERFRSAAFVEALRGVRPARFVVDEAHCISEWGHDFRPDYLRLREVLPSLGHPPLMAVTATATRRVQESIVANLGMREPQILVGGFNRPNLHYSVKKCRTDGEREALLERALPKLAAMGGSGLVYAPTRKTCERYAEIAARALAAQGLRAGVYHAGLEAPLRNRMQQAWVTGEVHTLVATNAFGMGIDKPDVRFVVHAGYPDSPESYYQEAGRAGRDGRKSRCVILTTPGDRRLREYFIDNDALTAFDVKKAFQSLGVHARENVANVPRAWWKQSLDWNDMKVRLALAELERRGLIETLGERADTQTLRLLRSDFPAPVFTLIAKDLERQREARYQRLDEMLAYCRTPACRRRMMLDYFGDGEVARAAGACCDNCEAPPKTVVRPAPRERVAFPKEFNRHDAHHVLQALDALWPAVGKQKLNQLLRGANTQAMEKFRAAACPLYGALRGASRDAIDAFLERLIAQGLLHQSDEEDFYVCRITAAGREAWQSKTPLDIALPGAPRVAAQNGAVAGVSADKVFEKLRNWRWAQAQSEGVAPYCVLPDRTLHEVARVMPQDAVELHAITGIGDAKLEKYGAALLGVLKGVVALTPGPSPNSLRGRGVSKLSSHETSEMFVEVGSPVPPLPRSELGEGPGVRADAAWRETVAQGVSGTVADTFLLLQDGKGIEEIAAERGVKASTIWSHLETLIRDGFLEEAALEVLIPGDLRSRVASALQDVQPGAGLRPVWDALGGEVDYGLIRCVAACIQ